MGYAVLHLEKAKGSDAGMSAHIERTISPKNADPSRTHLNRELIQFPEGVTNRTQTIQYRLDNSQLTRKIGKNQVRAIRVLLTGSHDEMKKIESSGQLDAWCNDNLLWLQNTYGKENLVSAVLHLDEQTAHLHATVIPITTGERRKAKLDSPSKKKKPKDKPRLCADDIMSRAKLKEYQNTYAEAMQKYGLQRGIEGSEAKHVSTSQYYRDLVSKSEKVEVHIDGLLQHHEQVQQELSKIKREIKTDKLKNTAVNVATSALEGIGSVFDGTKLKKQQQEITALKAENTNLRADIRRLNERISELKAEYTKTTDKLREELRIVYTLFPNMREMVQKMEKLCRNIGLSEELTQKVMGMNPIAYVGRLYSPEHQQRYDTRYSIIKINNEESEPSRLRLLVDNLDIKEWFKNKYSEIQKDLRINQKKEENRGLMM